MSVLINQMIMKISIFSSLARTWQKFLFALPVIFLYSCKDQEAPSEETKPLVVTAPSRIYFTQQSSSRQFSVSASVPYTAVSSDETWCTVEATSNSLTISVSNYYGHSERKAEIVLTAQDVADVRVKFTIIKIEVFQNVNTSNATVPFGDPFIMFYDGVYYAYGTAAADGIEIYTSSDMLYWQKQNQLALHKNDVYGENWFWAPEVYHVNGTFYMYYSGDEHICVAIADNPLGPFRQAIKQPMIINEQCIDNHLFIDDDGKPYMFFDRFNDGLNIWVAELEDNLTDIKMQTMQKCINVSQPWEEVWPRVNEGSFVIKRNGTYYMTYSANSYECQCYGIGVATATNVFGPWTKYDKNPIYQNVDELVGIGHSAMFTDKEGNLRIVFHAHNSKTDIHPRIMHISAVNFIQEAGKEILTIDPDYFTPRIFK